MGGGGVRGSGRGGGHDKGHGGMIYREGASHIPIPRIIAIGLAKVTGQGEGKVTKEGEPQIQI